MSNTGEIKITNDVISSIAGAATTKIDGVHSLSGGVVEGISEMLGKRQFSKGIIVNLEDVNHKTVDINMVVKHGYKVSEVAKQVQQSVKKDLKDMLDLKVHSINVYVDKVKIEADEEESKEEA